MKERLRYRSWTIGAKTLVSHALLALFAIVFACVVAYALSFRYVQDQAMEELVAQAEYIASRDTGESDELVIPDEQTLELYQNITNSMAVSYTHLIASIPRPAGSCTFTTTRSSISNTSAPCAGDKKEFSIAVAQGLPFLHIYGKIKRKKRLILPDCIQAMNGLRFQGGSGGWRFLRRNRD